MGIAEQRDAIRRQRENFIERAVNALPGLIGQAVDEVDIDAAHAGRAEHLDNRPGHLDRLRSVDSLLDGGVEVLNADAYAVDARIRKRRDALGIEETRVDLDGELRRGIALETAMDGIGEAPDVIRRKNAWRAAAPVHVNRAAVSR